MRVLPFGCVAALVICEVALSGEALAALVDVADERLLARVDALVRFEVSLFGELLSAVRERAFKRLFAALASMVTLLERTCVRWWIFSLPERE